MELRRLSLAVTLGALLLAAEAQVKYECPFFEYTRQSQPQPSLGNCSVYLDNACCTPAEVTAAFTEMAGLEKPNKKDEGECYREMNSLLCYFCSPYQESFYKNGKFVMCDQMCDRVWRKCRNYRLHGKKLSSIYKNSADFCQKQGFHVEDYPGRFGDIDIGRPVAASCHILRSSAATSKASWWLLALVVALRLGTPWKFKGPLSLAIVSALLAAAYLMPLSAMAQVSDSDVDSAALHWSQELLELGDVGLGANKLQQLYLQANYTVKKRDGQAKLQQVLDKFADFTKSKEEMALKLAERAQEAYASFTPKTGSPNNSQYPNSDHLSTLPNLYFDARFKANISFDYSSIKVSQDTESTAVDLLNDIEWSEAIDAQFKENWQKDNDIRWQYFGSVNGMYRSYPAKPWEINFAGMPQQYDPRIRPWFLSGATGPKDMMIVIDCSRSMRGAKWDDAMAIARTVIGSLSAKDRFNVVCGRRSHKDYWDNFIFYRSEMMSCKKHELVAATSSFKNDILDRLSSVTPAGGTELLEPMEMAYRLLAGQCNGVDRGCSGTSTPFRTGCQQFIVLITDGKDRDHEVRCGNGYWTYTDNGRRWNPPKICRFRFDDVYELVRVSPSSVGVFSYGLSTSRKPVSGKRDGNEIPGKIACSAEKGSYTYASPNMNSFQQVSNLFEYQMSTTDTRNVSWSSPYVDALGLGVMITVSAPVFAPDSQRQLGVVGIDVTLDVLIDFLKEEEWGQAYTFVVDRDGEAVVHPQLRDVNDLSLDVIFPNIRELEQRLVDGMYRPVAFSQVVDAIKEGQSGSVHVPDARRVWSKGDRKTGVVIFEEGVDYYFSGIPRSDFFIALAVPYSHRVEAIVETPMEVIEPSYAHYLRMYDEEYRRDLYERNLIFDNITEADLETPTHYQAILDKLDIQYKGSNDPRWPDLYVTERHSTYKLSPTSFCDSFGYSTRVNSPILFDQVEMMLNETFDAPGCPDGLLEEGVLADVRFTQQMEPHWLTFDVVSKYNLLWTYIGTSTGVFRIFPGHRMYRSYDPRNRPWYHAAVTPANRRFEVVVSTPYLDASGSGQVVTLARPIFQGGENATEGISCRYHEQCCETLDSCLSVCLSVTGELCSEDTPICNCSAPRVQAVAGADVGYGDFHNIMEDAMPKCGTSYACDADDDEASCETRCYLVDSNGFVVYDQSFADLPSASDREYEQISFARKEAGILRQMVSLGIFTKTNHLDFQGHCDTSLPFDPVTLNGTKLALRPRDLDVYERNRGQFLPYSFTFGCVADIVSYTGLFETLSDSQILEGEVDSPCTTSEWKAKRVRKTNLLFVAVFNRRRLCDPPSLNCHVYQRSFDAGSFRVVNNTCDEPAQSQNEPSLADQGKCPAVKPVQLTCSYDGASNAIARFIVICISVFAAVIFHSK